MSTKRPAESTLKVEPTTYCKGILKLHPTKVMSTALGRLGEMVTSDPSVGPAGFC